MKPPSIADMSTTPYDAYDEHNRDATSTIVLIHGGFTGRSEWDVVAQALSGHHLLIPDLPGHGQARQNDIDFSVETATQHLATLIEQRAHGSKAHIVGFSLGAHVAIRLVSAHPHLINTAFLSGFGVFSANPTLMAYAFWLGARIEASIPSFVVRALADGHVPEITNNSLAYCNQVTSTLCRDEWPSAWPARTLIIAAGKSGLLPTGDHPHDAVRLRDIGRQQNGETAAFTHYGLRHPWHRQYPELFVETLRAWLAKEKLPDGFVEL